MSHDALSDFVEATATKFDLPLRCRCGRMRGVAIDVSPSTGLRFVCYCKDCQAFAHFLERADVLDPAGGTDIFQMPPGRVSEFSRLGRCPRRIQDRSRPVQGGWAAGMAARGPERAGRVDKANPGHLCVARLQACMPRWRNW